MPVIDGMKSVVGHRTLRALLLGLVLIAAACSSSADTVSTEAADPADDTLSEAAPAADADESEAMADDPVNTDDDAMAEDEAADSESAATEDPADSGETSAPVSGPPPSLPPEEATAAAEQNIPNLQTSDDVRDIEVVSVYDGSVTSLREVVTGDLPVLVWFWAPH